ncbi:phosphatase PAP2 family protein [Paenibacillus larvae]
MSRHSTRPTLHSVLLKDLVLGFAAAVFLLFVFLLISKSLASPWIDRFDSVISAWVQSYRGDVFNRILIGITKLGNGITETIVFIIVAGYLWVMHRRRKEAALLFCNLAGSWLLNETLKVLFVRVRPDHSFFLVDATGYSFPSGHAMVSSSFYGFMVYLLWKHQRRKWRAAWLIPWLGAFVIFLIGFSRIYVGVHYPSDVLAGFAAGGIWLIGCIAADKILQGRSFR